MEGAIKKRKVEEEELPVLPRVLHPLIISHFDAKILMKMRCVCRLWRDMCWKLVTEKTVTMFFRSKTEDCKCDDEDECDLLNDECVKMPLLLQFRNRHTMHSELSVSSLPHFVEGAQLLKKGKKYLLNWRYARMKPEQNLVFVPCLSMQCILMCTILDFKILRAYHLFDDDDNTYFSTEMSMHIYIPDNCSNSLIIKYYSRSLFARLFLDSSKNVAIITSEEQDYDNDDGVSGLVYYTCTKRDGTLCLLWDFPKSCEIIINPGLSNQKNVIIKGKFVEVKDAGCTIGFKFFIFFFLIDLLTIAIRSKNSNIVYLVDPVTGEQLRQIYYPNNFNYFTYWLNNDKSLYIACNDRAAVLHDKDGKELSRLITCALIYYGANIFITRKENLLLQSFYRVTEQGFILLTDDDINASYIKFANL